MGEKAIWILLQGMQCSYKTSVYRRALAKMNRLA
jgi:hypothetical protein